MTTEQIDRQSPLVLDVVETLDDLTAEIAGEMLQVPLQTDAAEAKALRLISDQLRPVGGAPPVSGSAYMPIAEGDRLLAIVFDGDGMNERGFRNEVSARCFATDTADGAPDDYIATLIYDCGADDLHVETHVADAWLASEEEREEAAE